MTKDKINVFAQRTGWDYAEKIGEWNGYSIFAGRRYSNTRFLSGPLRFILVKGRELRYSSEDECYEIVDYFERKEQ